MKIQILTTLFYNVPHSKIEDIAIILVDSNDLYDDLEDEARQEEINRVRDILIEVSGL